jgi:hypothetical protein
VASRVIGSFSLGMLLAALGRNLLTRSSSYQVFAFILFHKPKHNIQDICLGATVKRNQYLFLVYRCFDKHIPVTPLVT